MKRDVSCRYCRRKIESAGEEFLCLPIAPKSLAKAREVGLAGWFEATPLFD
jgi:hypothetical protein